MSPDDVNANNPTASHEITKINSYNERVAQAIQFADGAVGEAWDGLFLMGLAMANLDLLPEDSLVTIRWYWCRAPQSKAELPTWPTSKIIERDAMFTIHVDLCEETPDDLG